MRKAIDTTIEEIKSNKEGSVVISGIQDENYQNLILQINEKISSNAFNPSKTILTRNGKDEDVIKLISDMNQGKIGALIMCGVILLTHYQIRRIY